MLEILQLKKAKEKKKEKISMERIYSSPNIYVKKTNKLRCRNLKLRGFNMREFNPHLIYVCSNLTHPIYAL